MDFDEKYMRRALQLAALGFPHAFPNPMVGAVIVTPDGNIIGEGYHRRCGEPHAEVNAVRSVADRHLLSDSTIYVTLEPCAHYGRTPPCSKLIIDSGIPRVVVGTRDPFEQVDGKGIEMLRAAGVDVKVGVLEDECRRLNRVFFTAHTLHRPFVMLKWARSADGFTDEQRQEGGAAAKISTPASTLLVHRLRACFDGIMVGSGTVLADNPRLDNRLWPGKSPRPLVLDRRGRVPADARIHEGDPLIINDDIPLGELLHRLYDIKITSLLVEGGATLLRSFIDAGLWDVAREEVSPVKFGNTGSAPAPTLPAALLASINKIECNTIYHYSQCRSL